MVKIYITRHGETIENAAGTLQGHIPGHLSERGKEQARQLRDALANVPFDALVVSDLQRALDTAAILNEPHKLPIVATPLLRERDWGEFTGKKVIEIRVSPDQFPPSVENPEQLANRARAFLTYILSNYDGKTILAVGHGYFNRCIVAVHEGKIPHDVPRWNNAEVRIIELSRVADSVQLSQNSEVSAD